MRQTVSGYVVDGTTEVAARMRRELRVSPNVSTDYGPPPQPFPVYQDLGSGRMLVPRFFLRDHYGDLVRADPPRCLEQGEAIDIAFRGTLRPEQRPIVDAMMTGLAMEGAGIINAACGTGKTAMANYIIVALKKKALIIVHNEYLLQQHLERLQQFTTARVGVIQGKRVEVDGCDVVLGMLQSICQKDFPPGFFDGFGTVVVDECHHIAARVFSRALFKVSTQYMIGLSATPVRKDGLSKVFHWFLGPVRYSKQVERDLVIDVRVVRCRGQKPHYTICHNVRGKCNVPTMITNISKYPERTLWIVRQTVALAHDGRQVLVLTDRRDHVKEVAAMLCDAGVDAGTMMGTHLKKEKEARLRSLDCQVIVGTYKMVAEGFDVDRLDTLVMATPIKDITQAIGRILRKKQYTHQPLIVDVQDTLGPFVGQGAFRRRQYNRQRKPDCQVRLFHKDLHDGDPDAFGDAAATQPPTHPATHPPSHPATAPLPLLADDDDLTTYHRLGDDALI